MKTINCAECGVDFQYEPPKGYPDKRKYCDPCGVKRKEQYNAAKASSEDAKPVTEYIGDDVKKAKDALMGKKDNGFALTIGNVRSNALASSIEWASKTHKDRDLMQLAKTFEQYILTGE